jgi:hypothetical protein
MTFQEFAMACGITVHASHFSETWESKHEFGKATHYRYDVSLIEAGGRVHGPFEWSIGEGIFDRWAKEHGPGLYLGNTRENRSILSLAPRSDAAAQYRAEPKVRGAYQPEPSEILECLASDAQSVQNAGSFEEWARDLGYDPDSRKAEHAYRACQECALALQRWLGLERYAVLLECEE